MLRIIGGEFRSRKIETPEGVETTRPLPDRVRVALFNMLQGHFEGQAFLDVFAGSGSFGLEALSRGAASCVFVERDREAAAVLKQNIETLGVWERSRVVVSDALGPAALAACPRPVHVVFFDPPYPMMADPEQRARVLHQFTRCIELLDDDGFAIVRTPWPFADHLPPDAHGNCEKVAIEMGLAGAVGPEVHHYGSTALHWYARARG